MTVVFWVATVAFVALAWRTPSGDADDRGNLSRSTRLGPLQCVERRRRLEGLLGQVDDGILSKLGGPGHTSCARLARRRQDRRGAK